MPSFSEYMKNREEIITVQLFPYEKEEDLGTFERTFLITKATNEASKCNCSVKVFDHESAAYTNMNGKLAGITGTNPLSTNWTQEIEVFAMNGSSFDKKYIVKEFR